MKDKISYSIGLWYGIAMAVGMAINLAMVIYDSVEMNLEETKHANRRIIAKSILRYIVVVILFLILGYFNFGNLFMAILGVFGLKASAYMQPLLEKASNKWLGRR